jgi:uncharacterized protein (TIGR03083 family)
MDHREHLEIVVDQAAALAAAARTVGTVAAVPATPEWSMAKLVKHTGTTHRWARMAVTTTEFPDPGTLDLGLPDEESAYPDWLEAGAAEFRAVLGAADPLAECWSWGPDGHVRFWSRRMAHETTIHRWDAESATGSQSAIDVDVARDGLDERLENLEASTRFNDAAAAALVGAGESIHLHATDGEGEWFLRFTPEGLVWTREHAKGDLAVRAPVSELLLLLLGRRGLDGLETFGDPDVFGAHVAISRF